MKLEEQVCSLELAKRLKELGVKQESAFYWVEEVHFSREGVKGGGSHPYVEKARIVELHTKDSYEVIVSDYRGNSRVEQSIYSAFTVAELGEILFKHDVEISSTTNDGHKMDYSVPFDKIFPNGDYESSGNFFVNNQWGEADARAKMLIYLIEKGIVSP